MEGWKNDDLYTALPKITKAFQDLVSTTFMTVGENTSLRVFADEAQESKEKFNELTEKAKEWNESLLLTGKAEDTNIVSPLEKAIELTNKLIELQTQLQQLQNVGTVVTKASGGKIYGTDTVPAMLTPGEFVVNKYASQKFLKELVAMNNVRGYASGGEVINNSNSFGNINVNLHSSGNEQLDARRIAVSIQREIRRGTVTRF